MKVFITGGTGTIGLELISALLEKGNEITILTRKSSFKNLWKKPINVVQGEISKTGTWVDELKNHDAIINLAGENIFSKKWSKNQKQIIFDSRVNSTQNLIKAMMKGENMPKTIISVSGTDYYPASETEIFDENSTNSDTFLGDLCKNWESDISSITDPNIRWVIFRMGLSFTHSGGGAERMFIPHKFLLGGWMGSGSQIYSWIHIDDFVGSLIWALENQEIRGVYNGVADNHSMKQLANIGGKILNRWTWTWVPGFILKIILGERALMLLNGRRVSSDKIKDAGYKFKFPTAELALSDILS